MASIVPAIQLSAESAKNITNWLAPRLTDLETRHSDYFDNIRIYWDWYEAQPKVKQKRTPWPGASNIVLPVIATASDSMIARFYNMIFAHGKIATGRTLNESLKDITKDVVDFMNWAADNEFDTKSPLLDWVTEMVVIGESVFGLEWDPKERYVVSPDGTRNVTRVAMSRGPNWFHIPRHRALWEPGQTIDDSEIFVRQSWLTYSAMAREAQLGGWSKQGVADAKNVIKPGSKQWEIEVALSERSGQQLESTAAHHNLHDMREIWLDTPIVAGFDAELGDQALEAKVSTLVFTYHRDTNQIFRVTADPYGLGHKPFYQGWLRKRSGAPSGRGVAKILEHHQRGQSTMVNQGIDAVTLANAMPFKTGDAKLAKRRLSPGEGIYDPQGTFDVLNKTATVQPEALVANLLQVSAERALGQSDPLLGRESRSGGHPSPATNFLGMIEQGEILQNPTGWLIRQAISKALEDTATLYQLFDTDPEGRLTRVLGPKDGAKVKQWMFPEDTTIIGNIKFDIFAADEQQNPQARQQQAVSMMQVSNNFGTMVLPLYQAVLNPQLPPQLRAVIADFIKGHTNSYIKFLEASEVDDVENFTPLIEEMRDVGVGNLRDFQQQARVFAQAQRNQNSVPNGAVGNNEQSSGEAAGSAPGPFRI